MTPFRLKLTGKTQRGRNRIREAGTDTVRFLRATIDPSFATRTGTWFFVRFETAPPWTERWIHPTRDPDFIVEEINDAPRA